MRTYRSIAVTVLLVFAFSAHAQNLAFKSAEEGKYTFDTGTYRGVLQVDDTHQGILSLVDVKTGEELAQGDQRLRPSSTSTGCSLPTSDGATAVGRSRRKSGF